MNWVLGCFKGILEWIGLRNKTAKVLVCGLEGSGKTSLLQSLTCTFDFIYTYNYEFTIKNINFTAYNIGDLWIPFTNVSQHFLGKNLIVFLVDASDPSTFKDAKKELNRILDDAAREVPVLVLGNKIDKPESVSELEIIKSLGISKIITPINTTTIQPGTRPIRLFMCSLKEKYGYQDAFNWVIRFL